MGRRGRTIAVYREIGKPCPKCKARAYDSCVNYKGQKKTLCRLDEDNGHKAPAPVQRNLFTQEGGGR